MHKNEHNVNEMRKMVIFNYGRIFYTRPFYIEIDRICKHLLSQFVSNDGRTDLTQMEL